MALYIRTSTVPLSPFVGGPGAKGKQAGKDGGRAGGAARARDQGQGRARGGRERGLPGCERQRRAELPQACAHQLPLQDHGREALRPAGRVHVLQVRGAHVRRLRDEVPR